MSKCLHTRHHPGCAGDCWTRIYAPTLPGGTGLGMSVRDILNNELYGLPREQNPVSEIRAKLKAMAKVTNVNRRGGHFVWAGAQDDPGMDLVRITVRCARCKSQMVFGITHHMQMYGSEAVLWDALRAIATFGAELCPAEVERVRLAEYLTETLAEAGQAGLSYAELIAGIPPYLTEHAGRALRMVRDMQMEEWGEERMQMVRLPAGHPMRDW